MRKSERINDIMIYLNDKNYFNLKDLMNKYNISKSTALRDIESLEEIGMPIYSQLGRNGHYGILQNRLLSPIVFTLEEMYALYFAMLTLRAYESTPFHLSFETLKRKFELCLSAEQINIIGKMEKILNMGPSKHHNSSPLLKKILQMAIEEKVCEITYTRKGIKKQYLVQFFDITTAYTQWYSTAFNYKTNKVQVFRCDRILSLTASTTPSSKPIDELKNQSLKVFKDHNATDFEAEIRPEAIDLFHKEHYPSMHLYFEKNQCFIRGFYNAKEEDFITRYLINYADNIIAIKPAHLKNSILQKLDHFKNHYQNL